MSATEFETLSPKQKQEQIDLLERATQHSVPCRGCLETCSNREKCLGYPWRNLDK